MTVFIDTTVLMDAADGEHPLREPCRRVVEAIGSKRVDAATSTAVIQEILQRGIAIRRVDASLIHEGIPAIVSVDREFDKVAEVRRIDPSEFAA